MYAVASKKIVNRCITTQITTATKAAVAAAADSSSNIDNLPEDFISDGSGTWYNRFISDLWVLRGYVFGFGLGVSVGVSFLYLVFLRMPGVLFITIWSMVLSIEFFLIASTILLWKIKNTWKDEGIKSDAEILVIAVFEYVGIAFSVLYACLILVLRSRIMLALAIVKEAAKALEALPVIVILPLIQVCGCVAFLIPWLIYMVYLASSGEINNVTVSVSAYSTTTTDATYREYIYDDNTKWAFLYLLFIWFWTSQFIVAIGQLTIAMATTAWYFTKDKSTIGNETVLWATRTSLIYHAGTAAFGSLIVAIFKTIRAVLAYIQRKLAAHNNKCIQCILCCMQCLLWCMEKCIKFLNKNAYIQTAIHGYSFCKASRSAFFLIVRNCLRVAAVNMSKVMIPAGTSLLCYLSIVYGTEHLNNEINGIIAPIVVCFILSYFVACMFMELFGMTIETILLCYIADEEMFEPADRYAEGDLHSAIQDTAELAKDHGVHSNDDKQQGGSSHCCGSNTESVHDPDGENDVHMVRKI
jgi:ferredoxin